MSTIDVKVPDIGEFDAVSVAEVLVSVGDTVAKDESLISLESDKATMEVPADQAGRIVSLTVSVGDEVSEGSVIATLEASSDSDDDAAAADTSAAPEPPPPPPPPPQDDPAPPPPAPAAPTQSAPAQEAVAGTGKSIPHASPSVRKFARELGVDLTHVEGSGAKGRIVQEDVQAYVKRSMQDGVASASGGLGVAAMPKVDFSKFGPVETVSLSRIRKLSGAFLHRNWVTIPHITQHDVADITEMEAFRKSQSEEAKARGFKLTPLVFLIKACVSALKAYPDFNASLDPSGESLIRKQYFNIGIAVDTPEGLVVPVIRDCDQKSLFDLAEELSEMSGRARDGKLKPGEMQGGCFSISSLGGIGGTAFTPIVNAPEVAILGVSRSSMQPVYDGQDFVPRLMLPLSLSYDHRVIDGAAGARFAQHLAGVLGDIRRLLL